MYMYMHNKCDMDTYSCVLTMSITINVLTG